MKDSYKKMVDTNYKKYGKDHYKVLNEKANHVLRQTNAFTFSDSTSAKLAAHKRWHPEWFNEDGSIKDEKLLINISKEISE